MKEEIKILKKEISNALKKYESDLERVVEFAERKQMKVVFGSR